jgi:3-phenylpropionate/cinnamic acid dioxygenase small subunit
MVSLDRSTAEDILFEEARILDGRRYREWLGMLTGDIIYWLPCSGEEDTDPNRRVSIVYDDAERLLRRVERLESGMAHAQSPPSRTRRIVSNVQVINGREGEADVNSAFILYELRHGKERIFAGGCEYRFRFEGKRWKVAFKKAILVNNDEVIDNLTFIV